MLFEREYFLVPEATEASLDLDCRFLPHQCHDPDDLESLDVFPPFLDASCSIGLKGVQSPFRQ